MKGVSPVDRVGPEREDILRCVHCGLCLSSCPTYRVTKLEPESPRGRIYLMRALEEGRIEPSRDMARHLDLCLGCRACETACPAGVEYGNLLERTRARLQIELPPTWPERARNFVLDHVFPYPERIELAVGFMRLLHRLGAGRFVRGRMGRFLPAAMRAGFELWPQVESSQVSPKVSPVPAGIYPPYEGSPKARVGWFRTCLMPALFPAADRAAVHLLREAGAIVVVPERQRCCGALHAHAGRRQGARSLARENLTVFAEVGPLDWIATDAAGCGATLREYGALVPKGDAAHPAAEAFADRVLDITEVLVRLGLPPPRAEVPERIAVHDACHLAHGQRVRAEPRLLLRSLPSADVVDLARSDWCCGSAGIYNLSQPDMAARLLGQKMDTVEAAAPTVVAVGNPGCLLQMEWGARSRKLEVPMMHPVELIARAYPRNVEHGS